MSAKIRSINCLLRWMVSAFNSSLFFPVHTLFLELIFIVAVSGFNPTTGIVVLAGTNRPDILDEALLRNHSNPSFHKLVLPK